MGDTNCMLWQKWFGEDANHGNGGESSPQPLSQGEGL